ncbi:MAG: hypothetical protein KDK34_15420, partial [Leptospiraceae bacterium]|nr:hypothetical protein [Leptospiraceae bacterium]
MAGGSGYMIITLRMAERDAGDVYFYQALVHKQNSRDAEAQAALSQARAYYSAHRSEYQQQTGLLKTNADQLVELLGNNSEISYIQHRMDLSAIQRKIL